MTDTNKSTVESLKGELAALRREMQDAGISHRPAAPQAPDYVAYGSEQHAALLGLRLIDGPEAVPAKSILYQSEKTKQWYTLEDPITPYMHFPDPGQMAELTLRQRVRELESGEPPVPEDSPPLWQPNL